jgi:uncharacterized phage protein (TIGR02220 family)
MSFYAVGLVDSWKVMKPHHRGLMYELANRHNQETGKCHPSHEYLAERLGITVRSVINLMNSCEELGYLVIQPQFKDGRQQANNYIIRGEENVTPEGEEYFTPEGEEYFTPEGEENFIQKQKEETKRYNMSSNSQLAEVIDYLNKKANKKFRPVESHLRLIRARLKEGYTVEEMKQVIDMKVSDWLTDKERNQYLRPSTLFNCEKFNNYVGNLASKTTYNPTRAGDI